MVIDKYPTDEGQIKIRFNTLCHQFKNNKRYISFPFENQTIPEETNISYEMSVRKKKFEALFYQKVDYNLVDTLFLKEKLRNGLEEFVENKPITDSLGNKLSEELNVKLKDTMLNASLKFALDNMLFKMPVWFRIEELFGQYYIAIFYDNEYNRANGEDL